MKWEWRTYCCRRRRAPPWLRAIGSAVSSLLTLHPTLSPDRSPCRAGGRLPHLSRLVCRGEGGRKSFPCPSGGRRRGWPTDGWRVGPGHRVRAVRGAEETESSTARVEMEMGWGDSRPRTKNRAGPEPEQPNLRRILKYFSRVWSLDYAQALN